MKELLKEKEHELKMIKSDCAAALMSKEKLLQNKVHQLESQVSDLEFQSQKQVQTARDK